MRTEPFRTKMEIWRTLALKGRFRIMTMYLWTHSWHVLMVCVLSLPCLAQTAGLRPQKPHNPNALEALTIIIRPEGFAAKHLKVPQGEYSLGVFNRSGRADVQLELDIVPSRNIDAAASIQVSKAPADKRTARWFKQMRLKPGYYRLRVADQPSWACLIEVE